VLDEPLSPMYDCVPGTLPHILGDPYNFRIDQQADRAIITYEKDAVVRTVWLEGHGHRRPGVGEYSIQGYSVGRFENGQLVVETTKFSFDPGGLHDQSPLVPSSTRKMVTERYTRKDDRLIVEAVMEDPLMMKGPARLSLEFQRTNEALTEWLECDPEQSRAPLRFIPAEKLKYGIQ
jgi:hypothetical protein